MTQIVLGISHRGVNLLLICLFQFGMMHCYNILWKFHSLLLQIAPIEIVDLPSDKMVDLSIVFVSFTTK